MELSPPGKEIWRVDYQSVPAAEGDVAGPRVAFFDDRVGAEQFVTSAYGSKYSPGPTFLVERVMRVMVGDNWEEMHLAITPTWNLGANPDAEG